MMMIDDIASVLKQSDNQRMKPTIISFAEIRSLILTGTYHPPKSVRKNNYNKLWSSLSKFEKINRLLKFISQLSITEQSNSLKKLLFQSDIDDRITYVNSTITAISGLSYNASTKTHSLSHRTSVIPPNLRQILRSDSHTH